MIQRLFFSSICFFLLFSLSMCKQEQVEIVTIDAPFDWSKATIYFLLTDRFNNGDITNDFKHPDGASPAALRGFMGGDIKGITQKIEEGYFTDLGVDAIWTTPVVQNIDGGVDEGTGMSYGFHGYWTKDWTMLDPRVGTIEDYKSMIKSAHAKGIRVIMDIVINHTGPVTTEDQKWPDNWVRTGPRCVYTDSKSTINCTLVDNLPDILTESSSEVTLPPSLVEKWKQEGRYEEEVSELDAFFAETGLPKTPANYIIKWLCDYIEELGLDGFRLDTVKHVEEDIWTTLIDQAKKAFKRWKDKNPAEVLDNNEFFTMGEVYNYNIEGGIDYDFGDRKANYFDTGMASLINFGFKYTATSWYDTVFTKYHNICNEKHPEQWVANYLSSHDDGDPFDKNRQKGFEAANKLLLSPGIAQIYYGDETNRDINAQASGDAKLRSFMNWEELTSNKAKQDMLNHWQKLGQFRRKHNAVTKGTLEVLSSKPYADLRSSENNTVVIGLEQSVGQKSINVSNFLSNGTELIDEYSGQKVKVDKGLINLNSPYSTVLLSKI
jgi:alpha-amylase